MLGILKRIKKLKVKDLKHLDEKLQAIRKENINEWREKGNMEAPFPIINIDDIECALIYCIYHFKGKRLESISNDEDCPCLCLCINCEMIPETEIPVMMQAIAKDMTEENVFDEFKNKYGKELNG